MNKHFFILVIVLLISCKKEAIRNSGEFIITVAIDSLFDGKTAMLQSQSGNEIINIDSVKIKNGGGKFEGAIKKPEIYGIQIEGLSEPIGIFMENKPITIQVNVDAPESSVVTGSFTHDDYLKFMDASNRISSKMNSLFPVFQKARAENDVEKLEELNKKMNEINNENIQFALEYAKTHPDSYISALALHSPMADTTVSKDTIAKLYNALSPYVKKGDLAMEVALFLEMDKAFKQEDKN